MIRKLLEVKIVINPILLWNGGRNDGLNWFIGDMLF